jgi:hypothetical protein
MRYLVRARVKPGKEGELLQAIEDETLGQGSIAEGEYLRNMQEARLCADQTARWVEVCYCPTPLLEEQPYWEQYFELTKVQDAHDRRRCRDQNGSQPWACGNCDCTERLEQRLKEQGEPFLQLLTDFVQNPNPTARTIVKTKESRADAAVHGPPILSSFKRRK